MQLDLFNQQPHPSSHTPVHPLDHVIWPWPVKQQWSLWMRNCVVIVLGSSTDFWVSHTNPTVRPKRGPPILNFQLKLNSFKWGTDWCTVIQTLCFPLYTFIAHIRTGYFYLTMSLYTFYNLTFDINSFCSLMNVVIMFSLGNIWDSILTLWRCIQLKYKDHTMLMESPAVKHLPVEWGRGAPGEEMQ